MICTFYSYKGGVGRSMALANAADILSREGFRVLMIDFDLEAPGLEQYFPVDQKSVRAHAGLFDLILRYKAAMASSLPTGQQEQDFRRLQDLFIVPIYPRLPSGGKLDLMPAGRRGSDEELSEYALDLRQFDWQDFYFNFGGEVFFEWLRRSLDLKLYDVVLVDSRTGVTEMGGICAYQLADVIIVMCASNQQNLDGTNDVVRNFVSHLVTTLRAGRALQLLVVPSRVETRDETLLRDFRERFEKLFAKLTPKELTEAGMTYWDLMIPYDPHSAFQERVVVQGSRAGVRSVINPAMQKLVRAVGLLAAAAEPVHRLRIAAGQDSAGATEPQYDVTSRAAGFDVFLAFCGADAEAVDMIARFLGGKGLRAFIYDQQKLSAGEDWQTVERRALDQCELCAVIVGTSGDYPWRNEYLRRLLEEKYQATGLRFLPILLPGAVLPSSDVVPQFLAGLQWLRLGEIDNDAELYPLVEAITSGSELARGKMERVSSGPPYKGLAPFGEADASIFFGRQDLVQHIIQNLDDSRFLALIGPSGVGKTSVVCAGVIPAIRRGAIPGSDRWHCVVMRVGDNPVRELFEALAAVTPDAASTLPEEMLVSMKLERYLSERSDDRYLLVIDQFEELFTRITPIVTEWDQFIELLLDIVAHWKSRIALIVVMRSDYIGRFLECSPRWARLVESNIVAVGPMNVADMRMAIEAPAQSVGLAIEAGLTELILRDAAGASGVLPLLQWVLRALWERRRAGYLTVEAYHELGGTAGSVAEEAEAFFQKLDPEDREKTRAILLRLVAFTQDGQFVRRVARLDELIMAGSHDDIRRILDGLVAAHLVVVSSERGGQVRVELVHEALIRHWGRFKEWVDGERGFLLWRQRLNASVKEWEGNKRSSDLLLRGLPLDEALDWLRRKPYDLSPVEREFVTASMNRKQRNRIVAATIAGLVLMVISGTTWLWQKGYRLDQAGLKVQSLFVSIHLAPEMQQVPAGTFMQGSLDTNNFYALKAYPEHPVTIPRFAMGKYEVTFDEYDRFAIATGQSFPYDQGWGRGRRPVISVSWEDAQAYAKWLSQATDKRYRLPTESEWEYAARSGGIDHIWAGTSEEKNLKKYAVYNANPENKTQPVGKNEGREHNTFGLYDMSGNVWEWVEDCAHLSYQGEPPKDGSAWYEKDNGDCKERVGRGGVLSQPTGESTCFVSELEPHRHPERRRRLPSCPGPSVTLCPLLFDPLSPVRLG